MEILTFTSKDVEALKEMDPTLAKAMDDVTLRDRLMYPDLFENMVRQMISQQISVKSATTVWNKVVHQYAPITPQRILEKSEEELASLGLSTTKARWIHEAAKKFQRDSFFYKALSSKSTKEIREHLLIYDGVGPWTADMLLIFSLGHKDILSYEDLGIRQGIMKLYGLKTLTKKEFRGFQEKFSPLGTLASLYFWAIYTED